MEVVGDNVVLCLEQGSKMVLGRGRGTGTRRGRGTRTGIPSAHPTVSRCQLALEWEKTTDSNGRVYLEVLGANPICIIRCGEGARAEADSVSSLEFLKKGESAYVGIGDKFSLSVKEPHFFKVKQKGVEEAVGTREKPTEERKHNQGIDISFHSFNHSRIDPVVEFGFLVEGSEFEQFGKRSINDMGQWSWCLTKDPEKSSDDEDAADKRKPISRKGKSRKKKEAKAAEGDMDWMGESEEEEQQINKLKMGKNSKNSTLIKTRSKSLKKDTTSNISKRVASRRNQMDNIIDNDDDDTLGGFIVNDDVGTTDNEDEEDELTDGGFDEEDEIEDEVRSESSSRQRKPLCKYGTNCYRKDKEHLKEFRHTW